MREEKKKKRTILAIVLLVLLVIGGVIAGNAIKKDSQTNGLVKEKADVETSADKEAQESETKNSEKKEEKATDKTEATKAAASSSAKDESKSKSQSKSSSSSTTKSDSNKNSTSSHKHNWVAVYKEVDNGYYKTVTEKVPYKKCTNCGADITSNAGDHLKSHALAGETDASSMSAYRYHETQEWVSKIEKVVDYYKCSCGATK